MENTYHEQSAASKPRLRAIIEIDGAELRVYPIAESDGDERRILDALRFIHKAGR